MSDQQDYQEYLQDLGKIRQLMEQSTRFFSLSGLSGVFAGTYALIGAVVAYYVLNDSFWDFGRHWRQFDGIFISDQVLFIMADAMGVLFLSLATGYFFSSRKAQKSGESLWNKVALRMVLNLFIPLIGGGFFCLALIYHQATFMVPSATLLFYGIALLNASKYTYRDIRYLGISMIMVGVLASYFAYYGLLFWALGFGVLHIVYGGVMYFKYDRG